VGDALRERADVSVALEILNLDPKAIVSTGDRKDIDKAGESFKVAREITAITSIEDLFDAIRAIVEVFSGVAGGVPYQEIVCIALCDPHEPETRNLLLNQHCGRPMMQTLATVVFPPALEASILTDAAASDQPFVLAAAAAAAVVTGSPILAAIDLAAARALRLALDQSTRRFVAGAPSFLACCNVLLEVRGNGWMPRAIRVAEQTGAPRSMVVTAADSFVRIVRKKSPAAMPGPGTGGGN
jgi:hypothetical protein